MISWRRFARNRVAFEAAVLDEPAVVAAISEAKGVLADLGNTDVRATRLSAALARSQPATSADDQARER